MKKKNNDYILGTWKSTRPATIAIGSVNNNSSKFSLELATILEETFIFQPIKYKANLYTFTNRFRTEEGGKISNGIQFGTAVGNSDNQVIAREAINPNDKTLSFQPTPLVFTFTPYQENKNGEIIGCRVIGQSEGANGESITLSSKFRKISSLE